VGNYHGLLSRGGVTFVAGGRASNAVSLTAAASGLVNMGNNLSLTTQDFTVAAWIKTAPGDTKFFANFLSKHEANYDDGYILSYNHPTAANGPNHAFLYASSRTLLNGSVDVPLSTTAVNDGNWHLIVGVYQVTGNTKIYVDGSPAQGSITSTPLIPNNAPFLIGGVTFGTTPTAMYSGLVDDVQVYKRALVDQEINYLFQNPGLEVTNVPPMIAFHPVSVTLTRTNYTNALPVALSVTANGASPLFYQWRFNGNDLPGATNPVLTLPNVTRQNNGFYAALVTNVAGSALSSNALVRVRTAQRFAPPWFTPGAPFRLRFLDDDGELAGAVDFSNLTVQATTNLLGTNMVWVTLTNGFSVVNGMLQLDDAAGTNLVHRYYRVIER
jgi:hypothetical protein